MLVEAPIDIDIEALPVEFEDGVVVMEDDAGSPQIGSSDEPEHITEPLTMRAKNVTWKKKNLKIGEAAKMFTGNNILELSTPYAFFKYFFDDDLINKIISESMQHRKIQTNRPGLPVWI
ncbi:hypothetical protein QE152_g38546 [Popillia japonica]|uniref:PiggyBac transposable element-derived protein domain-containing protein n=1 Tax=Popillia japonica TaxID=7064 RepID=A0AAW1HWJ7_POPJA